MITIARGGKCVTLLVGAG